MRYTVEFAPRAARDFRSLERATQQRLRGKIDRLEEDPRPRGCEKLTGADDLYRIRVGDYRIVYQVRDRVLVILVVRIGHRRDVYRRRTG